MVEEIPGVMEGRKLELGITTASRIIIRKSGGSVSGGRTSHLTVGAFVHGWAGMERQESYPGFSTADVVEVRNDLDTPGAVPPGGAVPVVDTVANIEVSAGIRRQGAGATLSVTFANRTNSTQRIGWGGCPIAAELHRARPGRTSRPDWVESFERVLCPGVFVPLVLQPGQEHTLGHKILGIGGEEEEQELWPPPGAGEYYVVARVRIAEPTDSLRVLAYTSRLRLP
jgi:hypothetical protein